MSDKENINTRTFLQVRANELKIGVNYKVGMIGVFVWGLFVCVSKVNKCQGSNGKERWSLAVGTMATTSTASMAHYKSSPFGQKDAEIN